MNRPKRSFELKPLDKTIEILTGFLLFFMWVWLLFHYEKIPTHFNFAGTAFGHKNDLFILAVSTTIIYILLSITKKICPFTKLPCSCHRKNALYYLSNQMLRYLKFLTILAMCVW